MFIALAAAQDVELLTAERTTTRWVRFYTCFTLVLPPSDNSTSACAYTRGNTQEEVTMEKKRSFAAHALAALTAIVWLAAAAAVQADGLIVVHDPPPAAGGHFRFAPLEVRYHRVSVEIRELAATTTVDQEFLQPQRQRSWRARTCFRCRPERRSTGWPWTSTAG